MPAPAAIAVFVVCSAVFLALAYLIRYNVVALQRLGRQRDDLERAVKLAAAGETRFRALLEAAPDAMITVARDGRILVVNSQTETLFGYTRDELIGQPVEILLPDALRQVHVRHRGEFYEHPRRRPMGVGLDLVARRKDGSVFPTEISLSPLETTEGLTVIVVIRDVTERRKADEERAALVREQAARVEAEAANRAKDDFVAMVSHELRTPLNALLGWAVMLRTRSLEPAVVERALEAIERNAKAQRQLIDDLLDMSRMVTGKISLEIEQTTIDHVIAAALDAVRPAVDARHLQLDVHTEADLPPILADPRRVQQVLWNLLSNAVKFTPEGGQIRLSTRLAGANLEIEISDTGIGIPASFLPHLFSRFRQRDSTSTREYGGLGLGLAIVRQLVELHGGSVRGESAGEGHGSTFTVTLPVPAVLRHGSIQPVPAAKTRGTADRETPNLHGIRVLVVDDDPETRDLLEAVLKGAGAQVVLASSGTEALARLSETVPDVLMSDLAMPQIDGYELVRRVHERRPTLPSIALTALSTADARERAVAAGFEHHVTKPFLPGELLSIVATTARGKG